MIDRDQLLAAAGFVPERMVFPNAWCGHLPFASWLISHLKPACFVELGTHTGNSYLGFCQSVVASKSDTRCYAVDTWQGDEHAGYYGDEIYENLCQFHNIRYASFSRLIRSTFDQALEKFPDASIDLLHIDGLHTYEAVRHDFESWLPKLAPGAIVLFHDTAVRERGFGVWKLWGELCERYPNHLEFVHSNGLGVLQVDPVISHEWLVRDSFEQRVVRDYFSALGDSMLQRYRALEQTDLVAFLQSEIEKHRVWEQRLSNALVEKDQALKQKDADLAHTRAECNHAFHHISSLRSSTSWRVTAPLRLLGHLIRGNFHAAFYMSRNALRRIAGKVFRAAGLSFNSSTNLSAIAAIVDERCRITNVSGTFALLCPSEPETWPLIDICVVTYNSQRWINDFARSLLALSYPKEKIHLHFVDNCSTDSTLNDLKVVATELREAGFTVDILTRPNNGFGAGHNAAIGSGSAPFCLVTNIDLTFEPDALTCVVATALSDTSLAAAWELRQKPFEHPKFYDPVTGTTNWNSHACVLLRRSAFESVGGYDEALFMYGEDVELSYRLRRAGYFLRYCPAATVWHYSYETADQVKPLQYAGSTFANLYIRLKYGTWRDIAVVPLLAYRLASAREIYPGSKSDVVRNLLKLVKVAPRALLSRKRSQALFPFRNWDYELAREGSFWEQSPMPKSRPLISVITRTYQGRELFLRQAMHSVARQTWDNLEHIVVEDGGDTMRSLVEDIAANSGRITRFIPNGKHGRSAAGNAGLAAAQGRWCLFLDDDDLLFADHLETLASALLESTDAVASYALAMEVVTDSARLSEGCYQEVAHYVPPGLRQEFDYEVLRRHNFFAIQSVLFERSLYLERGGFEEDMDALEDWTLWCRYAHDHHFLFVPKVTSLFRTPADPTKIHQRTKSLVDAYARAIDRINARVMELNSANSALKSRASDKVL